MIPRTECGDDVFEYEGLARARASGEENVSAALCSGEGALLVRGEDDRLRRTATAALATSVRSDRFRRRQASRLHRVNPFAARIFCASGRSMIVGTGFAVSMVM